jgi:uncharacterized OB-fold protein
MFVRTAVALVLIVTTACGPSYIRTSNPPAPVTHTTDHPGLYIGAPVAARWQDGKWYFGHIADIDGGRFAIDYADGDKGTVAMGEILPIAPPQQIVIGARVMAVWKGATMYPGTIIQVYGGKARVQWDDGDLPLDVPLDQIAVMTEAPAANVASLSVGTKVAAKWKDGHYWYGSIGQISAHGYVIHYADGDVLEVAPANVIAVAAPGSLQVGDHVIAVWQGAKMYPGVITRVDAYTATVQWDDGDTPLDVPLAQIAKR